MPAVDSIVHNPVGELAADHPGIVRFGRVGWLAKGIVYLVAGALALLVAAKASGWSKVASAPSEEASPTGALKKIAHITGGPLLMWLVAIGMLVYAAWRVVSALLPGGSGAETWAKRIGYGVSAVHVNEATGLDGALRRLATETWGLLVVILVILVGLGFAAYGLFCVSTFTRRRLRAP